MIGNESPVYATLRKQQEEEERKRKRKRQLAIQEIKVYTAMYEEQIVKNLSAEGIKKNVEQLSSGGFEAKRAAGWLVLAGSDTLPYMHEALLLAELVPSDEFEDAIKKSEINPTSKEYYEAFWLSKYRNATSAKKAEASQKLLQSEYL